MPFDAIIEIRIFSPRRMKPAHFVKSVASLIVIVCLTLLGGRAVGAISSMPLLPPWSAMAFLLAALVVLIHSDAQEVRHGWWTLPASVVLVIGLIAWAEHIFNRNFGGFDRLVLPSAIMPRSI